MSMVRGVSALLKDLRKGQSEPRKSQPRKRKMVNVKDYAVGSFLKPEEIKMMPDKTATITEEGSINPDTPFGKEVLEVPVLLSNGQKVIYGMNKTSCGNIMEAYGEDTKNWKDKKIRFEVLKQNVRGQMKDVVYAYPL